MSSRRRFLKLSALSAAAAGFAPRGTGTSAMQSAGAVLPPSIAALTSMRDQAKPISAGERRGRLARAQQLMAESRIDAIVLTGGTTLTYFTGARWGNSERLMALVLPSRQAPFLVCPAFEEDRVREQLRNGPIDEVDVRTWQEHESPFARVVQGLRDRGVRSGRVGLEETTKFVFSDGLAGEGPSLKLTSATPVTAGCRMIKDRHELDLMRLASQATLRCYRAVFQALRPGMTETDVRGLVSAAYGRLGFPGFASVQVGEYTALPHGSTTPQTIREGTIIMMDDGCTVEGYQSDITRTFVLGTPTATMRRVYEIVLRAQTAALRIAKPGVSLDAIDRAARDVIDGAGYGPGFKYFTHRLGHGLGMDMHEWPYLVERNMYGWDQRVKARAGMTFSDEPGIYIPGEFGVRIEDDMVITDEGAELLTTETWSIEGPPG